jgi:hypothetical protein
VHDVLRVLEPIWHKKTETASRLRGRIENVLSWATVAGHRAGDNPARWKGNLSELLAKPTKVAGRSCLCLERRCRHIGRALNLNDEPAG